jgi:hypothetical protein
LEADWNPRQIKLDLAASIPLVWGCMTPQETYHHVILGFSHSQVKGQNEGTPSLYKYEQYDIL